VRAEAPPLLDVRSRAEAEAAVESARAALGRARAEQERAKATLALAQRELARVKQLAAGEAIARAEVETREADLRVAEESVNAAGFAVRAGSSELQRAEARLMPPSVEASGRVASVVSPVDGVVLKRVRESESYVPAGDPLIEIGDRAQLEIVADLLSTDAVRVAVGSRAIVDQWGGDMPLDARVRRIEPSGFMKVSALGVEEQRVNVVLDFADAAAAAQRGLGDGYRVEARVVLWESGDVLRAPTGALFREGEQWAVYIVAGDRAQRTPVRIGHQAGQYAEVLSGLSSGDRVIVHPGDTLTNKARVHERVAR
jgi:HlyD family secretion protein